MTASTQFGDPVLGSFCQALPFTALREQCWNMGMRSAYFNSADFGGLAGLQIMAWPLKKVFWDGAWMHLDCYPHTRKQSKHSGSF